MEEEPRTVEDEEFLDQAIDDLELDE